MRRGSVAPLGECSAIVTWAEPARVGGRGSVHGVHQRTGERLTSPREMSLDQAIEYLRDDELLEVTPESLRIRKRILDTHKRGQGYTISLASYGSLASTGSA